MKNSIERGDVERLALGHPREALFERQLDQRELPAEVLGVDGGGAELVLNSAGPRHEIDLVTVALLEQVLGPLPSLDGGGILEQAAHDDGDTEFSLSRRSASKL